MTVQEINVHDHKIRYGQSNTENSNFKRTIYDYIYNITGSVAELNKIDVYNMNGESISFNAGSSDRAIIFGNATKGNAELASVTIKINDIEIEKGILGATGNGVIIQDENGNNIAEYHREYNELYILFDVFHRYNSVHEQLFKYILEKWNELVWSRQALEHSWIHTSDKDALTSRFKQRMERQLQREIADHKDQINRYENNIDEYKRKIKQNFDNLIRLRNQVENEESNLGNVTSKLIKDLDLIVQHGKISDLHIKDGRFILHVPNVYCYDDKDRIFYLGNFRVEIKLENADVKFFGDNPRRSYWSEYDPHPHVDGRRGNACLGNVSATIAELASRNEIYALALVCIDFLESANTSDPAGRNVTNWQQVNEKFEPIETQYDHDEEPEYDYTCDACEEGFHGDGITVYRHFGEDGHFHELYVCDNCLEDYTWWDSIGEYVHDDYSEDDYFDNEGGRIR